MAVQGQMDSNKFKLSMWDALFQQDTYVASVTEDKAPGVSVIIVSSPYHYRFLCLLLYNTYNNIYYIDTDEIPVFVLSLKSHTIFLFHM